MGQSLKAYCYPFFKTVGQPTEPRWSSMRLTRQDSSSLETAEAWVKGSSLPLLQGLPAEIPCFQRKTRSHRCTGASLGFSLLLLRHLLSSPSIFSLCVDPELPSLLSPHEALNQQKSFWKPKESEAGFFFFFVPIFPFFFPFLVCLPCLTTVWEFKKKGLGLRRETEKGKKDRQIKKSLGET